MEPVHLVCEGCGARIKTSDPSRVRGRACPRCGSPLDPAVDRALGIEAAPTLLDPPPRTPILRRSTAAPAILAVLVIGSVASLAVREGSPGSSSRLHSARRAAPIEAASNPAGRPAEPQTPAEPPAEVADEPPAEAVPDLASTPAAPPRDLAILRPDGREAGSIPGPRRTRPSLPDEPPPAPSEVPATTAPVKEGPRRILVRDRRGRAVVAREHGTIKDRMAVVLSDGSIGWPDGLILTEDPFVPASMEEMRLAILEDPEFAAFRVLVTEHYLIAYQCTTPFAKASGELLERLHGGLTGALRKVGLPVKPMEFPLVAVIFKTEDDFRANRRVNSDVQAYYEILSNRIYFYETSRRDQDSPEVSALRKPQTVAHEGTHQILHNLGIQPRLSDWPLWLVEGLAEYCSPPKFARNGVDWAGLGQVNPMHLATIRDLEDPMPDRFRGGMKDATPARDPRKPLVEYLVTRKELTPTDYALSWALTHYLATQRVDQFVAYVKRMSRLKPFEDRKPDAQLADFREAFGDDLAQMDARVAKHLKKFKQADALPFYAVIFEQPIGQTIRRSAMVSQSPSVIRQWLDSVTAPEGGERHYQVLAQPSRKKALEAVEQWVGQGR